MQFFTVARLFAIGGTILLAGWASIVSEARANDVSITSNYNGGQIVVSASADRFAGAIDSITFRGVQYIDTYDHGRELATALQVDGLGECFNPTEPGSFDDARGPTSSSVLQSISNTDNILRTQTNMVNWLRPGQASHSPCLGYANPVGLNLTYLSGYILNKIVSVYSPNIPNLFIYNASISVPDTHNSTNTEAATAYLPSSFSVFLNYDRSSRTLTRINATATDPASNGLTPALYTPVIVATPNGANAMGVIYPATYDGLNNRPYYAYFAFPGSASSSKWSCVFGGGAVSPGSILNYTCGFAIGSVDEVINAMNSYPSQPITSNIPIFRFYGLRRHFFSLSYDEGTRVGFTFETTGFHVFQENSGVGYYPLYRCFNSINNDHYISTQSNCKGYIQEGTYGYAAPAAGPGLYPLYRFYRGSTFDHLETISYTEGANNGYSYEGILGYVSS